MGQGWTSSADHHLRSGVQRIQVFIVDPRDGSTRAVFEDHNESFVDEPLVWHLEDSAEFLISSERDGWNHLYLVDEASGCVSQVTTGEWAVHQIHHVDEQAGKVFFSAGG